MKMEETRSNRIETPIKDKYLLMIREAGAYFSLGTKYTCSRITEINEGGFAIVIGNRYMIVRTILEKCFEEIASNIKCTKETI